MKSNKYILIFISIIISILLLVISFQFDSLINQGVPHIWNPILTNFFLAVTFIGDTKTMIFLAAVLFIILTLKKDYRRALIVSGILVFSAILTEIIKFAVQRARPVNSLIQETGYSFPSFHAVISLVFFSILIYLFKDKIKNSALKGLFTAVNIILILLIGFSRIYLNVHWFSDVIAGFLIGILIIYLSVPFLNKTKKHKV